MSEDTQLLVTTTLVWLYSIPALSQEYMPVRKQHSQLGVGRVCVGGSGVHHFPSVIVFTNQDIFIEVGCLTIWSCGGPCAMHNIKLARSHPATILGGQ